MANIGIYGESDVGRPEPQFTANDLFNGSMESPPRKQDHKSIHLAFFSSYSVTLTIDSIAPGAILSMV